MKQIRVLTGILSVLMLTSCLKEATHSDITALEMHYGIDLIYSDGEGENKRLVFKEEAGDSFALYNYRSYEIYSASNEDIAEKYKHLMMLTKYSDVKVHGYKDQLKFWDEVKKKGHL